MRRILVIAVLCTLLACTVEPPPLTVTSRDSLVGAGKIVQLENTSSEPLTEVQVLFRAPGGEERTYRLPQLDGFAKVEIGWKKLGGWQIEPGTELIVSSDGFRRTVDGVVE